MMNDAIEHWTVDHDGHTYEVSIVPDDFTDINDFDCYGQFEWGRRAPPPRAREIICQRPSTPPRDS